MYDELNTHIYLKNKTKPKIRTTRCHVVCLTR